MPIPVLPGSLVHLAAVKGPLTVCTMSRCRRDSFYLAPGLLRYFKDCTLATWDPDTGELVRFFHRNDVAAFAARFPTWDGVCLLAKSGGLAVLRQMLREEPGKVELWRLDARIVQGRRPANACSYVMHRWAVEGTVPGGAHALIPLLFPGTEPLPKGLHVAALHAIRANAQLAIHVVSSAWQAGLFSNPAQAASMLRDLTSSSSGVLVEPDPRLISMLSSGLDPANLNLKGLLTELANPYTHINPASVSLMLDLNTPLSTLRRLEVSADENILERIWEHRNYPRGEYLVSVRRAINSTSEDVRRCAAARQDLPDEMLFEFATSKDPVVATGALRTLRDGLLVRPYAHAVADRWAADSPQIRAERAARLAGISVSAWGTGDAKVRQSVLKLVEELDPKLLYTLTDELLKTPLPLDMDEETLNLYVAAALSRCREGSPITEEAWSHIGKLITTIQEPSHLESWYATDLYYALRSSLRDNAMYISTDNHELRYEGIDLSKLAVPQHIVDALISSKVPRFLEALAANPHLGHETTRRLLDLDADGSLAEIIAVWSNDHAVLRELFARDAKFANLVAKNSRAPRDLLLMVAANKATYDISPYRLRDTVSPARTAHIEKSTYEEVMRNRGLGNMTLDELEGFLLAQHGDGSPRVRDDTAVLRTLVYRTSDSRVVRLAVSSQPELWLDVLDLPSLPDDMRRAFITAAATGDGGPVGLGSHRLASVIQHWLHRTTTVSVDELWSLAGSPQPWTRTHVAEYTDTPADLLEYLSHDLDSNVISAVLVHKNTPSSVIDRYVADPPPSHFGGPRDGLIRAALREDLSQESAWTLAASREARTKWALASNTGIDVDLLRLLVVDPDDDVRATIADNLSTPSDLLLSLAKDRSAKVRGLVANNPNLPQGVLLGMLKDESAAVVKYAIAACYDRGVVVPTEELSAIFEHPEVVKEFVDRGRERSWWWNQNVEDRDTHGRVIRDDDISPLAFVGQMLHYDDPKVQALLGRMLDAGSFNADPDMHECVSRLLNRPLPLRLRTLEEQRRLNTPAVEPVEGLDDLGLATVPYPMEGIRAELTERFAVSDAKVVPGYGVLAPRMIQSPAAQRRNGNYMGNCTFSLHGDGTKAGYKAVVGFYGEGSNDPVLNALLVNSQTGWLIQEVNNRFNANVTRAAAEAVASIVGLPLDPRHQYLP